jgi:3-deoxy-D-manno-octulosonic-acid transferase/heptosyltransferase-1
MSRRRPHILLVKLSAVGDVVHTLPALNALRRHLPEAHITWLVEEAAAGLVVGHPAIDRVLVSKRKRWTTGMCTAQWRHHLREVVAFIRQLRDARYDWLIDFQAALKGAALIAMIRADRKIGFGPGMEHQEYSYLVLNEKIPMVSMEVHALKRSLMLMEAIGVPCPQIEYNLPIDNDMEKKITRLIADQQASHAGPAIAINPVALWKTKMWSEKRFAQLADRLVETYQADIFFTGALTDSELIDRITGWMQHDATNLAGQTSLLELAAFYRQMTLVISTDTGPMHIAAAVKTPVVALFGPTAEWRTGPYGRDHRIVSVPMECRPCFKRSCDHCRCMQAIEVEDVLKKAEIFIQEKMPR